MPWSYMYQSAMQRSLGERLWVCSERADACCDHHFQNGITDMETAKLTANVPMNWKSQQYWDAFLKQCPYRALEEFRKK